MRRSKLPSRKAFKTRMDTPRELLTAILRLTSSKGAITAKEIIEESILSRAQVERTLELLAVERLVEREGTAFKVDPAGRVLIAAKAVGLGASVEGVSRHLSWQEFEQLIEYALNINGYATLKHHHLKAADRKCEIDVIGARGQIVVAVDCKHWSCAWKRSEIKKSAERQLERVRALASQRNLRPLATRLGVEPSGRLCIVPVVATLKETAVKVYSGVPIVPVYKFARFLEEVPGYLDHLSTITVDVGGNFT